MWTEQGANQIGSSTSMHLGREPIFKQTVVEGSHKLWYNKGIVYHMNCGYYAINKAVKLGSSCCIKPVIATHGQMLKRMNEGLIQTKSIRFPNPLRTRDGEIKAYVIAAPKRAAKPWAVAMHLQPESQPTSTGTVAI